MVASANLSSIFKISTGINYSEILQEVSESEETETVHEQYEEIRQTEFQQKVMRSTLVQGKLREDIDKESYELKNLYNKLESSSCYGKLLISQNFIVTKEYETVKAMLKKELYSLYDKISNYKIQLVKAFGLVTKDYFEFYKDEHCSQLIFKLDREQIDIVSIGIRTFVKNEEKKQPVERKQRKTMARRRDRMYSNLSESKLDEIAEEKSDIESDASHVDVSGIPQISGSLEIMI